MEKISIIIPNYNCEKYIIDCLNSIIEQNYEEKEIIIIDDGSTDSSLKLIEKFIKENETIDIKLICQNNLNAAIARNEGIKVSSGRYLFFLDSDDVLEKDILSKLVKNISANQTDLIIGNYEVIDEDSNFISNSIFFNQTKIYNNKEDIYKDLVSISAVPSNKLYDKKIIEKNNLSWGNVRIGQDLNFYLKYLLLCEKISVITDNIYKYRIVNQSMSRTYDFKIFDIVNSLNDVKKYYIKNNKAEFYEQYIQVLELKNYNSHIWKQEKFKTKKERNVVVDYFSIHENKIDYSKCLNYNKFYKKMRIKFKLKTLFKFIYTSNILIFIKKMLKK